ncbi:hypothetical protein ACFV8Z_52060 [Streptomyces sp. NPDC059837]|uniref:hypothetical protein n=1 Tax=unclassified Streptomyces TaxID=2593676 RepID=UPI00364E3A6C
MSLHAEPMYPTLKVQTRGLQPKRSRVSADKAAAAMQNIRPETATNACRRDIARDLVSDLCRLNRQVTDNEAELRDTIAATGTTLTTLPGLGTVMAAQVIGHVCDLDRFPTPSITSPATPAAHPWTPPAAPLQSRDLLRGR